MNKKDLNIKSQLYSFSLLDNEDELEKNADEVTLKIKLYTVQDFKCYMQAMYDLLDSLIQHKKLVEFTHLLNVFSRNIYVARTNIAANNKRIITDFIGDEDVPNEWSAITYARGHIQHIIDKFVSVDFNPDKLEDYLGDVFIWKNSTGIANVIYNVLSIPIHHTNYIMVEFENGMYRSYDEYDDYKEQIIQLMKLV